MKTLRHCKDLIAKKHGYKSFKSMEDNGFGIGTGELLSYLEEAAELYYSEKDKEIERLRALLTKCDTTFGLIRQVIDNVKEQREIDPELLHVVVDAIDIDFELIQAKIKDELRTKP